MVGRVGGFPNSRVEPFSATRGADAGAGGGFPRTPVFSEKVRGEDFSEYRPDDLYGKFVHESDSTIPELRAIMAGVPEGAREMEDKALPAVSSSSSSSKGGFFNKFLGPAVLGRCLNKHDYQPLKRRGDGDIGRRSVRLAGAYLVLGAKFESPVDHRKE